MRLILVLGLLIVIGCSKQADNRKKDEKNKIPTAQKAKPKPEPRKKTPAPKNKTEKSTAAQVIEHATGKAQVEKYKDAKKKIEEINKKQQERLDMIKEY